MLLLSVAACGDAGPVARRFAASSWDTVLVIGGGGPQDTTLLQPLGVLVLDSLVVVLEPFNQYVRAFGLDGRYRWTVGRRGAGPGEFAGLMDIKRGPRGSIWAYDGRNTKIVEIGLDGTIRRESPLTHLPVIPRSILYCGRRVLANTQISGSGTFELDPRTLEILSAGELEWSPNPGDAYNLATVQACSPDGTLAVQAFYHGPGFRILDGDEVTARAYIERVPFALKSGPRIRAMGADSARFGAVSAAIAGESIYFLFGGRPRRQAHRPSQPP